MVSEEDYEKANRMELLTQRVHLITCLALTCDVAPHRTEYGGWTNRHRLWLWRNRAPSKREIDLRWCVRTRAAHIEERAVLLRVDQAAGMADPFDVVTCVIQ